MVNNYLNFKILLYIMCSKTHCFITYVFYMSYSFLWLFAEHSNKSPSSLGHPFTVITPPEELHAKTPVIYATITRACACLLISVLSVCFSTANCVYFSHKIIMKIRKIFFKKDLAILNWEHLEKAEPTFDSSEFSFFFFQVYV